MFKRVYAAINRYWHLIVGDTERFSFESRIFHSISVIALIMVLAETILNIYTSQYECALLTVAIGLIQIVLYYLSRFKNKLQLAFTISAIEINLANAIGYFYNSGLTGSTLLLFAVCIFLVILVAPKKQWLFWFLVNIVTVLVVVLWEYKHPGSILHVYGSRDDMFADISVSYIVVVSLLFLCTMQVRNNYDAQKRVIEEKAMGMELMNGEKDRLFSIISHDLNAPLASIKQYLDLLSHMDLEVDERRMVEKELMKSIGGAQELLTNLLHWAKSQMKHVSIHLQDINLKEHLCSTISIIEQIALKKDINIVVAIDEEMMLHADINMLQLIVRNVLYNAVKFTNAEGRITLSAVLKDGCCVIAVKDNGVGIPLDKQANVFSSAMSSTYGTVNEKGTGLGLVLCKDYAVLQGGDIWFESSPGIGSTFYVCLPAVTG